MIPRSLRIFNKKKGIYLYPDQWAGIFLTVGLFSMAYLEQSDGYDFNGWVTYVAIIWFLYVIGLMVSTFFRYEKELGEYSGSLTMYEDKVKVDGVEYKLSEIVKLDFVQAFDVKGKFKNSLLKFTPHLSNGLDNTFVLILKDGQRVKKSFLQTETARLKHYKVILIHYHKKGVLGWLQLLDLLEITDYDKIQAFKNEINN